MNSLVQNYFINHFFCFIETCRCLWLYFTIKILLEAQYSNYFTGSSIMKLFSYLRLTIWRSMAQSVQWGRQNFCLQLYFLEKWKKTSQNLSHFENESTFLNTFWKWKHIFLPAINDMTVNGTVNAMGKAKLKFWMTILQANLLMM